MSRWDDDDDGRFGDAPTERGPAERPPVSSGGDAGYEATVGAGDGTQYMPPPRPPGGGPPDAGGPEDDNRRQRRILFVVAGVLAVIIIVLLIILLTSSGSSNTTSPTTSTSSTSTATTTATTATAQVSIQSFNTPSTVSCSSATTISVSWSAPNATQVTLSIDGGGAFKTYSGPTGADSVPFACDGHSHTYTITARNGVSSQSRTQTVTQISPPTTSPTT
ncbi:MAG TPA: hypothetical protein VI462_11230 [Acidimicrobiia bacterium]